MFATIAKNLWATLTIISTIGGALATYQLITDTDDYSLTLYKKNEEKLIERNKSVDGLTVAFQGHQLDALYGTQIELVNTGKKAITKEFIFQPATVYSKNNAQILKANPKQREVKVIDNSVVFSWELLNPGEKIKTTILSTEPIDCKIAYRIKEVQSIEYIDELLNPPRPERLKALSIAWLIIVIVSIIATIDAIGLIKNDAKLQAIFDLPTIAVAGLTKTSEFLEHLSTLYKHYYESTPRLIVTPEEFDKQMLASISASTFISEGDVKVLQEKIIEYARYANLYTVRSVNIFLGPLFFGFCVVRVVIALI